VLLFSLRMGRFYTSISLSTEAEIGDMEVRASYVMVAASLEGTLQAPAFTNHKLLFSPYGLRKGKVLCLPKASIGDSELRLVTPWLPTPWKVYIDLTLTCSYFRQLRLPLQRHAWLGCMTCCEVSDVIVRN